MDLRLFTSTPVNLDDSLPNLNNNNSHNNRAPNSPAMSSNSNYSNYSNNGNGNLNGSNNSRLNQQRLYGNKSLMPGLSNNISPLSVNNWVDQQTKATDGVGMGNLGSGGTSGGSGGSGSKKEELDEEVIPTAIVIKNIPFSIKKEALLDEMTKLNLPLPYAFNYHFDNGVFRGLAFANFTSTDETAMVVNNLNSKEIGGRKLRVEYKKMLPLVERERIEREKREKRGQLEEQHRSNSTTSLASLVSNTKTVQPNNPTTNLPPPPPPPPTTTTPPTTATATTTPPINDEKRFYAALPNVNNLIVPPQQIDFNNPEVLELYSNLLLFKHDSVKKFEELVYPLNIPNNYKKYLNGLCTYLNLNESYENGLIIIRRKFATSSAPPAGGPQIVQRYRQNQNQSRVNNQNNNPNPPPSNTNMSSVALLRGTRSFADVRNAPFNINNIYNGANNNGANSTNNITSPTYLNVSQPPTPGIDVNSRFNGQSSHSNANANSPYQHSNNSGIYLGQQGQNTFNPPSNGLYKHFNSSNPSFVSNNHSMINLTQNLTGGDTFTTTINTNLDDLTFLSSPSGNGTSTSNNTPTSLTVPNSNSAVTPPSGVSRILKSNSPSQNNANLNSGKNNNLISSLSESLGGLNLNNNNTRRDIWGSGRLPLI